MTDKTKKYDKLSSNMEDYLETVIVLKQKDGVVRAKDISELMNVTKASVSCALKTLSRKGFVLHEKYGYVDFTPKGEELANKIKKRHDMLTKFLKNILGLDNKLSEKDACKIEHALSTKTSKRLAKFVEFVQSSETPEWLKGFNFYIKTGKRSECKYKRKK